MVRRETAATAVLEEERPDVPLDPALDVAFFGWLIGESSVADASAAPPLVGAIAPLLERVDQIVASDTLRAALLPRAPHVVPQLMKTLRDERYSAADVAARISTDVALRSEVIRAAARAAPRSDDDAGEIDLGWAVAAIGTQGLRRAIASVVLRPIFDARDDTLSGRAGARIWKDADRKARLCTALAAQHGVDAFDAYLAGLLFDTGWTALLRAIDGLPECPISRADLAHPEVVPLLHRRRDALFGTIVGPWNLSPAVSQLALAIAGTGLATAPGALALVLRQADRLAAWHALGRPRPADGLPFWATLEKPARDCYAGLSKG